MYNEPFEITEPISSNAFNYEKRSNPKLHVPSVVEGELSDVQVGEHVVFEDFDEYDQLQSCIGLKHLVKAKWNGIPVVVVDNHNHVFYFWYEARANGVINDGATLFHLDAHKDERIPEYPLFKPESEDLEKVFEYTNSILNVGNYIPPAVEEGLVGELVSVTSEAALREQEVRGGNLIVNVDLDFWAPEMDYIDHDFSIKRTKQWLEKADLITVATSPFFIDQERAIKVLHELFE